MRKIIPLVFISLFLLFPLADAQNVSRTYCTDNSTLETSVIFHVPETNRTRTLVIPQDCPYGCANNECRQPPWITYAIIFGLIIVAAIIYILITHKT